MKQIRIFLLSLILLLNSCIDNREAQIKKHRLEFEIRDLQNTSNNLRNHMKNGEQLLIGIEDYELLTASSKNHIIDLESLITIEYKIQEKQRQLDLLNQ